MSDASLFRQIQNDFRATWQALLAADVAYGLVVVALVVPLLGLALRLFLATSGRTVAADQDIARFLLSPVGLVALMVIAAVLIAALGLQIGCLLTIGWARIRGGSVSAAAAVAYGLRRAGAVVQVSYLLFLRISIYVLPVLGTAAVLYLLLLRRYDINYYLSARPDEFVVSLAVVVLVATLMAFLLGRRALGWLSVLPLLLFEGASARRALAESERRATGDRAVLLRSLSVWLLFWLFAGALVTGLVGLFTRWLVPRFEDQLAMLALVVGLSLALTTIVNVGIGFVQVATFSLLIGRLHERYGEPQADEPDFARLLSENASTGWVQWLRVRASTRTVLATLFGIALVALAIGGWALRSVSTVDEVEITAHRGASKIAPENTLAAVEQALLQGADWVEIDVQETADGEVVVMHDSDFMKISGTDLKIWDAQSAQLAELDIGSWFGSEFADERVPTLREVLDVCRGKADVVVELKYYGRDQKLEERVIEIIEEAGMVDSVMLMSLKYEAVQKLRQMRPDWTIGLLAAQALGDLAKLDADFLAVNSGMVTPGFVRRARSSGKDVLAWTVNTPAAMSAMISRGVDGLITDEPALARRVLEQRRAMNSAQRLLVDLGFLLDSIDDEAADEADA